mmetsp:Transcript_42874/g.110556  ORF Transcript_42874/g.110556 Transcript_42874/m.110556 type:complete len:532 (+) Transcript_42874:727-2322(+)
MSFSFQERREGGGVWIGLSHDIVVGRVVLVLHLFQDRGGNGAPRGIAFAKLDGLVSLLAQSVDAAQNLVKHVSQPYHDLPPRSVFLLVDFPLFQAGHLLDERPGRALFCFDFFSEVFANDIQGFLFLEGGFPHSQASVDRHESHFLGGLPRETPHHLGDVTLGIQGEALGAGGIEALPHAAVHGDHHAGRFLPILPDFALTDGPTHVIRNFPVFPSLSSLAQALLLADRREGVPPHLRVSVDFEHAADELALENAPAKDQRQLSRLFRVENGSGETKGKQQERVKAGSVRDFKVLECSVPRNLGVQETKGISVLGLGREGAIHSQELVPIARISWIGEGQNVDPLHCDRAPGLPRDAEQGRGGEQEPQQALFRALDRGTREDGHLATEGETPAQLVGVDVVRLVKDHEREFGEKPKGLRKGLIGLPLLLGVELWGRIRGPSGGLLRVGGLFAGTGPRGRGLVPEGQGRQDAKRFSLVHALVGGEDDVGRLHVFHDLFPLSQGLRVPLLRLSVGRGVRSRCFHDLAEHKRIR